MRETAKQRATRIRLSSARKSRVINSPRRMPERDRDPSERTSPPEQNYVKRESAMALPA